MTSKDALRRQVLELEAELRATRRYRDNREAEVQRLRGVIREEWADALRVRECLADATTQIAAVQAALNPSPRREFEVAPINDPLTGEFLGWIGRRKGSQAAWEIVDPKDPDVLRAILAYGDAERRRREAQLIEALTCPMDSPVWFDL